MRRRVWFLIVVAALIVSAAAHAQLISPIGVQVLQQFKAGLYSRNTADHAEQVAAGKEDPFVYVVQGAGDLPVSYYHFPVSEDRLADFTKAIALPPGLCLTPISVVKDTPARHYVTVTVYEGGGERRGTRAEWTTYVMSEGGTQPHVLMLEAASSEPWLNPVELSAYAAERFVYQRIGRLLFTHIVSGATTFTAAMQVPRNAERHDFVSRELNVAGDVVYWRNGVSDLQSVNALIANRQTISIPSSRVKVRDGSSWAVFTEAQPEWVLLYDQPMEMAVRPWVNADDPAVPLDPDFRARLLETKASVYSALEFNRSAAIAGGLAEPLADFLLAGDPPAIFLNFEVLPQNLVAFAASIPLPAGFTLAPIEPYVGLGSRYFLSLNVYLAGGLAPGLRAEWSTYVRKDGDSAIFFMIVEAETSGYSIDPLNPFNPITMPADVFEYELEDSVLNVRIESTDTHFLASIPIPETLEKTELQLDWAESNNRVYWRNGVADKVYYNGSAYEEVSIVPNPGAAVVTDSTRFADYVQLDHIFIYEQPQVFVASPWTNLDELANEFARRP